MKEIKKDKVVLVRCLITFIGQDYIKAKDYQGNKYLIEKNASTRNFVLGEDRNFYAVIKDEKGILDKKPVLYPLTNEEYLESLGNDRIGDKTLRELDISLSEI